MSDIKFNSLYGKDLSEEVVPIKKYAGGYPYTPMLIEGNASKFLYPSNALAVVGFSEEENSTQPLDTLTASVKIGSYMYMYDWDWYVHDFHGSNYCWTNIFSTNYSGFNGADRYVHISANNSLKDIKWIKSIGASPLSVGSTDAAGNYVNGGWEDMVTNKQILVGTGYDKMPAFFTNNMDTTFSSVVTTSYNSKTGKMSLTGNGNAIIGTNSGAPYGQAWGIYLGYQNNTKVWGTTALRASFGSVFSIDSSNTAAHFSFTFKSGSINDILYPRDVEYKNKDGQVLGTMHAFAMRHPGEKYHIKGLGQFNDFVLSAGNSETRYGLDGTVKSHLKCLGTYNGNTYVYFHGDHKITSGVADFITPMQIHFIGNAASNFGSYTNLKSEKYKLSDSWIGFQKYEGEDINGSDNEPLPNTFRFEFSDSSFDPTNVKSSNLYTVSNATWKKVSDGVWDCTISGTTFSELFKGKQTYGCTAKIIATGQFNSVGSCYGIFSGCSWLTWSCDWVNFAASTAGNDMFMNCTKLTRAPKFSTTATQYFNNMFYGCSSLTEAPRYDVSNASNLTSMFQGCSKLKKIEFIDNSAHHSKNGTLEHAFDSCNALQEIPRGINYSNFSNFYMTFAGTTNLRDDGKIQWIFGNKNVSSGCNTELMFVNSGINKLNMTIYRPSYDHSGTAFLFNSSIEDLNITIVGTTLSGNPSYSALFNNCKKLKRAWVFFSNDKWNDSNRESNFVSPGGLFRGLAALETVIIRSYYYEFSSFQNCFTGCTALKSVFIRSDCAYKGTGNYTRDMSSMFEDCKNLSSIEIESSVLNYSSDFEAMFKNAAGDYFKNPTLNDFSNAKAAPTHKEMFANTPITTIPKITINSTNSNVESMFEGCTSLTTITIDTITNWYLNSAARMFKNCTSVSNAYDAYAWFQHYHPNGWHTDMFANCGTTEDQKKIPTGWGGLLSPDYTFNRPYTISELSGIITVSSEDDLPAKGFSSGTTRDVTSEKKTWYVSSTKKYYYYAPSIKQSGTTAIWVYTLTSASA